jgi:excisionase family DNA binding protein
LSTQNDLDSALDDLISQAEAARLRGVSRQAIRKLVEAGRLGIVAIGGKTFVRRSEVLAYVPHQAGRPRKKEAE